MSAQTQDGVGLTIVSDVMPGRKVTDSLRRVGLAAAARRVHVLHVVPTLAPGGMELALSRVVNALVGRGIGATVVCLTGPAAVRERIDESVEVHCMDARPHEMGLPLRLRRLIRRVRPTAIHARNWGAWPDVAAARLLAGCPAPLIFSFHGLRDAGPMPLRRKLAARALAAATTKLFTVSEASRRFLAEEVHLPEGRIDVIPNGVDTRRFSPGALRAAGGTPRIGTVGSLTPVKNQALLVRASAELARAGVKVQVDIAGDGPDGQALRDLAASLGAADRVRLLGHVADVPGFLGGLDVFVLPSDSEAHPNALLEAMACGLPCVATRVGGVPEVLDEGGAGVLVDPGDLAALAAALAGLLADPPRRVRLGRAARERVCRLYSLDRMVEAYARLYEGLSVRPARGPIAGHGSA